MAHVERAQSLQHRIRRTHAAVLSRAQALSRADRLSAEEIRRFQERRLRALVRMAAVRSPFYRRWFAESGVDPRSIRALEDLGRLPLLERRHLAERPEESEREVQVRAGAERPGGRRLDRRGPAGPGRGMLTGGT